MEFLKVENLKKDYGDIKALKGINFEVKKGEILGLLGPNGAGKSTTISIISTLISKYNGSVKYKGIVVNKSNKEYLNNIGVVPQEIALYKEMTGLENLKFFAKAYGIKGEILKNRIDEIKDIIGIDKRLKDKVKTYSGGMQRRLNIGVALMHKPKLLIMDEPTVGIDPQSRKHILDTVLELNKKGMTIIYTSHYMEEVEYLCDRIYILDKGNIIASGTKEELIEKIDSENILKVKFSNISIKLKEKLEKFKESKINLEINEFEIKTENTEKIMEEIFEITKNYKENILSVDVNRPNLETLFLHLTGKDLRD
ncbi:MAG: ABC transporter ATP-binding protein [Bacillota bacterium]